MFGWAGGGAGAAKTANQLRREWTERWIEQQRVAGRGQPFGWSSQKRPSPATYDQPNRLVVFNLVTSNCQPINVFIY